MASEETTMAETAQANMSAAFGGIVFASQNMQAIASEFAKMSLESLDNATNVVDRFSKASSWDQIFEIQNKFLKSSIDTMATHGAKVAELISSWPREMGKTYRRGSHKMAEAGGQAIKSSAERASAAVERMAAASERAGEALRSRSG